MSASLSPLRTVLLAAVLLLFPVLILAQSIQTKLAALTRDPLFRTSQLALCVYDLTADTLLFEYNAEQRMRPASTQKIITAVAALDILGPDYRISTALSRTGHIKDGILYGDLFISAAFDPTFNAASLNLFIQSLNQAGIDSVAGRICADLSMKDSLQWGSGWCWDDDMPRLTPLLFEETDSFMPQITARLRTEGIGFTTTAEAIRPDSAILLTACTTPLTDLLQPMMKKSDNLYAEAVFYHLAAHSAVPYASRSHAAHCIDSLTSALGFVPEPFTPADGSGVSLYNYVSARLETAYLKYAFAHKPIFNVLYPALPISGTDGTLKNRMRETDVRGCVHAKTGTVNGVSSLAGYVTTARGHLLAFCILNQGITSAKPARQFQDKVCRLLRSY